MMIQTPLVEIVGYEGRIPGKESFAREDRVQISVTNWSSVLVLVYDDAIGINLIRVGIRYPWRMHGSPVKF